MNKIGIIGAMSIEVETLIQNLKAADGQDQIQITETSGMTFYEGKIGSQNVVIVQSGVGKVNAAICAQTLILKYGATAVINTGIAGALGKGLGILDFVISTDAVYHDVDATAWGYEICQIPQMKTRSFPADEKLVSLVKKVFKEIPECQGHKIQAGTIASGDKFVADNAVKNTIKETCNPLCVEMEGAAIAHACYLNKVPFIILRTLSDMADDSSDTTYVFNEKNAASISSAIMLEILKRI
ncbi:MAG: 5'-methylthioadenosine/adenosylhomocysteine nucleosidase [Treponema sp.]|nr:5'-methylthioadenosine/adenosylhomocysteine nucleosidase [Treponema sp.]